ncbi:MAG: ATP-binding cassette domain-containing protein, partial [Acidimicrobiales bacterium]
MSQTSPQSDVRENEAFPPILRAEGITKAFLGNTAVNGATFEVPEGQITALIGPNGAGKSTVVNILSGALASDAGTLHLGDRDVTNWPSHKIAQLGLMRTFQLSRELGELTVLENLLVAPKQQSGESLLTALFRPKTWAKQEREHIERALEILNAYGLYALR